MASEWGTWGSYLWTEPSPRHSADLDWCDINLDNNLPFFDIYFCCKAPTFPWKAKICHPATVLLSVTSACIAQLCPNCDFVWAHCVFMPINYWCNKYGWGCSSKRCLPFWLVQCTHQKWICCSKMTFHALWLTSALEYCVIFCFISTCRGNFWENTPVLAVPEVEPFCCRWPLRNSRPASAGWTPAWGKTSLSMWSGCSVAACAAAALWAAACGPWSVLTKEWVRGSSYSVGFLSFGRVK